MTNKQAKTKSVPNDSKQIWFVSIVFLVVLFFVAMYGYIHLEPITSEKVLYENIDTEEAFVYNGYPFIKENNFWTSEFEKNGNYFKITREYSPREVENLTITYLDNSFSESLDKNDRLYVAIDPEDDGQQYLGTVGASLILSLKEVYGVRTVAACTQNHTLCNERPIVNCETARVLPVIVLKHEAPTKIEYSDVCLTIQGEGEELIKAGDKAIYGWYGITK